MGYFDVILVYVFFVYILVRFYLVRLVSCSVLSIFWSSILFCVPCVFCVFLLSLARLRRGDEDEAEIEMESKKPRHSWTI